MPTKITQKKITIRISATLLDAQAGDKVPNLTAYAFSAGGRLLDREPMPGGKASLSIEAPGEASPVRVVIGPDAGDKPTFSALSRRGAVERTLRVEPNASDLQAAFDIFRPAWICWLKGLCFVPGTVLKRTVRDGVTVDLPVCDATVEVYEVDRKFIIRLPDIELQRIRDFFIDPGPLRLPRVIPDPPPEIRTVPGLRHGAAAAPETAAAAALQGVDTASLQLVARAGSLEQFRLSLADNLQIRPLLCILFPGIITTQLVATAKTDECGHFRAIFSMGCDTDKPDLYFKVKQKIFGFPFPPITIHAPTPIACHTRWNYACGSDVTIFVTHPLAQTCSPCPDVIAGNDWVLFMAIGNHPLSLIRGTATSPAIQASTTATNLGLTSGDAPWGGLLRPRLEFDNSLREDGKAMYYRVSWRRQGEDDTKWRELTSADGDIVRHYIFDDGSGPVIESETLGPKTIGTTHNLIEIPPALPPKGQWSIPDAVEDTTSVKFPTAKYVTRAGQPGGDQAGKYQLKVELFNSAGNLVNIAAAGIKFVVPATEVLTGTIETTPAADLGLVSGNAMIVTLHIDNNVCSASIAAPSINGIEADGACGVLAYSPLSPGTVVMPYSATHPHGFANFSFAVQRGDGTGYASGESGPVNPSQSPFSDPVSTMLGGCKVAGFAETLYVAASATDGWSRQSGYDASAVRAFVLGPVGFDA